MDRVKISGLSCNTNFANIINVFKYSQHSYLSLFITGLGDISLISGSAKAGLL